jgi:3-dehydroquinate synthase
MRAVAPITEDVAAKRIVLVSDDNVGPVIGKQIAMDLRACLPVEVVIISAGEESKDVAQLVDLWVRFKDLGVERRDLVIGVGGGVICDIVGLTAATYLRGLPYVLVPTSLMAQVDAAIGGKVGADFLGSKNWIGGFYHPVAVVGFIDHLQTLDDNEFANGFAEIVKAALITGGDLWREVTACRPCALRADPALLARVVRRCALEKLAMLAADPLELSTLDRALNFGHCVGHAIEAASGFKLRHGQAVALGMATAMRIGQRRRMCDAWLVTQVEDLLLEFELPITLPKEFLVACRDRVEDLRKVRNGALRLVIPTEPGKVEFLDDITCDEFLIAAGHGR